MTKKIVTIVGARPQFVKAAVVSRELKNANVNEIIIHTGQHYDENMSDVFFDELQIPSPKFNLGIGGGTHGEMTGRQLADIEKHLLVEQPDLVLVYGDTNSTLAGALAAVKLHIPVAHVEAGLRSFNWKMPEEINRILTDRISTLLFSPSRLATENLKNEGIPNEKIIETGDVMYDAALLFGGAAQDITEENLTPRITVTIHRAENTDNPARLSQIVAGLIELAKNHDIVFPVHPRTKQALHQNNLWQTLNEHVKLVEPLGYIEMLEALRKSTVVLTDSGGVQKEAYFVGTPCVTLRNETEWEETIEIGWNRLVKDLTSESIVAAVGQAKPPKTNAIQPYGNGQSSKQIAFALKQFIGA